MRRIGIISVLGVAFLLVPSAIPGYMISSEYELRTGAVRTTTYRYLVPTKTRLTEIDGWPLSSVPEEEHVWKTGGCTRRSSFFSSTIRRIDCGMNWGAMNGHRQLVWLLNEIDAPLPEKQRIHVALGELLEDPKGWWVTYEPENALLHTAPVPIDAIFAEDYEDNRVYLWRREPITPPPPASSPT